MSNELAHGFDPILIRYLPELLSFRVKPNSVYPNMDYGRDLAVMLRRHGQVRAPECDLHRP